MDYLVEIIKKMKLENKQWSFFAKNEPMGLSLGAIDNLTRLPVCVTACHPDSIESVARELHYHLFHAEKDRAVLKEYKEYLEVGQEEHMTFSEWMEKVKT